MTQPGTVLLAEDDTEDVILTQHAFKQARLANPLQVVRDGEQALAYLQGQPPYDDPTQYQLPILLLLDLNMPKIDGFEVLESVKKDPALQQIPVAILTSSQQDPHANRAFQLGADSYLVKPPKAEELLALVQRIHAYWLIQTEITGARISAVPPASPT